MLRIFFNPRLDFGQNLAVWKPTQNYLNILLTKSITWITKRGGKTDVC